MSDKVKTAIFGKDLRVELKNHSLSATGNKISIVPEGAGYFMPEIGPTTFLDWPIRKKYFLFGKHIYKRIYFTVKKGAKCVDFIKEEIYGPDVEQVKKANLSFLAQKIGSDKDQGTPWYIWPILTTSILSFLLLLNISGVLR